MKSINRLILSTSPPSQTVKKPYEIASLTRRQRPLYGRKRRHSTGKERDSETGLYYYGARYLDSKTSRWLSGDPAMGDYVPSAPVDDETRKRNKNLPGQGGVFNYVNLHVYHYAGNNPVRYTDPNGEFFVIDDWILSFIGNITGARNDGILKGTLHNFINTWEMLLHSIAMWPQTLWFAPQEVLGLLLGYFFIGIGGGTVVFDGGFKYIEMPQMNSAVTLGSIGMGNPSVKNHEKGHYYQSWLLGWNYLFMIGMPSFAHASLHFFHLCGCNYYSYPTEEWADELKDSP